MATFDIDFTTFGNISSIIGSDTSLVLVTPDGNSWVAMITTTGNVSAGQQSGTGKTPDDAIGSLYSQLLSGALADAASAQHQLVAAQATVQTKLAQVNSISAALPAVANQVSNLASPAIAEKA